MDVELRQIRQLVAIVETGSYRAAAERLHIAQPALSVSIRKMEHAIGITLLLRDSRGARLTDSGAAYLHDARHVLALGDQSMRNARLTAAGEAGTIRVGFVGSAVYNLLPRILPAFRARHSAILVDLHEGATIDLLKSVEDWRLDCAIVRGPLPINPEFEMIEVEQDHLVALLPASHQFAEDSVVDLSTLSSEPFVLFSRRTVPGLRAAVDAACATAGFVPLAAQEVTQSFTMVGLVGSGIGVALSPAVISNMAGSQVRFVPLSDQTEQLPLRLLAVRRRLSTSPALDHFWESLAERS